MKSLYTILCALLLSSTTFAQLPQAKIYSEIYNEDYDFENNGFTFSNRSFLDAFRLSHLYQGVYGTIRLKDGSKIFADTAKVNSPFPGIYNSYTGPFQLHADGSFTNLRFENDDFKLIILDENLNETRIEPNLKLDLHGVGKLSNGLIVYALPVYDTLNFYNPPQIDDNRDWPVVGHDIYTLNPTNGQKTKIFDWFNQIPITFILPEYMYEGDQGPSIIDWGHYNWVNEDWDMNLIISWRHMGICKIDVNNGNIIWWTGLPTDLIEANGIPALECISGDCRTRLQHNFKPIKGQPGKYTVFDNGDRNRLSSRALFLSINEDNSTVEVTKEVWDNFSPFMGSVDVLEDGSFLVNTPQIGNLPFANIAIWSMQGVLADSLEKYLPNMGSQIKFYDADNNLISKYWTDSANFVYQTKAFDYSDWPSIICDGDSLVIDQSVDDLEWVLNNTVFSNDASIAADGSLYKAQFSHGITTGYTEVFNSNSCMTNGLVDYQLAGKNIYPNPSSGSFYVDDFKGQFKIYNSYGSMVYHDKIDKNELIQTQLAPGMYFIVGEHLNRKITIH